MRPRGSIAGAWSPLRHSLFRDMWIASVASNVGTWMQTVGAAWLMTSLAASPLMVALVQTATTLPIFLLGLPAGALADMIDRRKFLIFTQTWMLAAAAALGGLTLWGVIGPWWLLSLTFALGIGSAMNGPAWSATVPELVPRHELPAAVSLNSVGFNIARAVGPALGGIIMAAANAGFLFVLNGISFLGVIVVLWRWRERPRSVVQNRAGIRQAVVQGLIYVRDAREYHSVLIRSGIFALCGSALWALLPVVAKDQLGSTSLGYGVLLGCLGAGSVAGAAFLAPLRARYSVDQLVSAGIVLFSGAIVGLAFLTRVGAVSIAMIFGGLAWITVMSSFNVCAQMAPPAWVRARALAVYLLVFQGSLAIGSGVWGEVARLIGVRGALTSAAIMSIVGVIAGIPLKLSPGVMEEPVHVA